MSAIRLPLLQTIGSITVFALVALSGLAALALSLAPDTPFFWYLDREVFGVARFARNIFLFAGPTAALMGLGGMFLALAAYWKRSIFGAGLVSHACFALLALPTYAWVLAAPDVRTASLIAVDVSMQTYVVTWLSIAATILSMAACHLTYLLGIFRRFRSPAA